MKQRFNGIEGLEGREPIGAVLTIGTKGPSGAPVDRDRFYIKSPKQDSSGGRPNHPQFKEFNKAPVGSRTTIKGNIVHATVDGCFEHRLTAYKLPNQKPTPNREPACQGDGVNALRWNGSKFQDIVCPNELCEFRQGDNPACKPFARLLFRPSWQRGELPSLVTKYTTHGWNTCRNLKGFLEQVMATAKQFGMTNPNIFGLPFVMTLSEETQPQKKRRYPVITFSPDGDLIEFFMRQSERIKQLERAAPVALITDGDQQDANEQALDHETIVPGKFSPKQAKAAPVTENHDPAADDDGYEAHKRAKETKQSKDQEDFFDADEIRQD